MSAHPTAALDKDDLPAACRRVVDAFAATGTDIGVRQFVSPTRTAEEAATAIGCSVAAIAKSLMFRTKRSMVPVLVVTSGVNRVDLAKVRALLDGPTAAEPLERPDAAYVREITGFAIGGVPPFGFPMPITTVVDEDLMTFAEVWAAAGTPNTVFPISPAALGQTTAGIVGGVRAGPG